MACVVREFHPVDGRVVAEYYFKHPSNAYGKMDEIIRRYFKVYPSALEELIEGDYLGNIEDFVDVCFTCGEMFDVVEWEEIKFLDEEKK
jgi:hypothetical protein